MINYAKHDEEFYGIFKLVSGEEVLGKAVITDDENETLVFIQDPVAVQVITKEIDEQKVARGMGFAPWMQMPICAPITPRAAPRRRPCSLPKFIANACGGSMTVLSNSHSPRTPKMPDHSPLMRAAASPVLSRLVEPLKKGLACAAAAGLSTCTSCAVRWLHVGYLSTTRHFPALGRTLLFQ